jgi:hypothetical protein
MMRRARQGIVFGAVLLVALIAGCSAISKSPSVPPKHPEELAGWTQVDCLECHSDLSTGDETYASFGTHDVRRITACTANRDRTSASRATARPSARCHARKEELKPSTRMGDRPDLALPHRGDYIVQHQLEGRMDPGSCFRCHGNKNDAKCRACHR